MVIHDPEQVYSLDILPKHKFTRVHPQIKDKIISSYPLVEGVEVIISSLTHIFLDQVTIITIRGVTASALTVLVKWSHKARINDRNLANHQVSHPACTRPWS
jgi:hypothetical protein